MPKLISETEIRLQWPDLREWTVPKRAKKQVERSSGVHVSGIVKYCLTEAGLLTRDDEADEPNSDTPRFLLRMAIGMAWEAWVVGLWKMIQWQPGEVSLDGITGSPDGITNGKGVIPLLEEFKVTWKSLHTHKDVLRERIWMWQIMAYLKLTGLRLVRLHVLWVNGDYRPPDPRYTTHLIEFSQKEIDGFWENVMLKNRDNAAPEEH
jgi:hypothetical protein